MHPPASPSSPLQDGDEMSWDSTGSPDSTLWDHASVSRSQSPTPTPALTAGRSRASTSLSTGRGCPAETTSL
jgi:hypothetical protein